MKTPILLLAWILLARCSSQEAATSDTAAATTNTVSTDTAATSTVATATLPPERDPVSEEGPLAIMASAAANENLFMLRLLDEYYREMPSLRSREDITRWLSSMRWRVDHARQIIRDRRLDPDIDALYADCGDFLDVYESVLTNMGMIDRQAERQATADAFAGVWEGYKTGSKAESTAKEWGASDDDASGAGALVGILAGMAEYGGREKQRNAVRSSAIDAEQRRLNEAWQAVDRRSQATAQMLARRHLWRREEAGFTEIRSRLLSDELKLRPRDPFSKIRYASHRVENEKPASIFSDARMCIEAAELVPAPAAYDDVRQSYLYKAAELALLAAATEAGKGGYSARPSIAKPALVYANTYLAAQPEDPGGRGRLLRARALAFAGRYGEAVTEATAALDKAPETWRADRSFPFLYAKMLTLDGQHTYVGGWLRRAFANGSTFVDDVRTGDDFARYRAQMPEEFRELTKAKVTWDIEYGIFNDDIIIRNQSAFGLSNARIHLTIRKGDLTWSPKLESAWLPPGGSQRFVDVVSIPNDSYDDASGSFTCDECPD